MVQSESPEEKFDPDVEVIAQRIESYLVEREGAADTLEGVVHWWLMQQRILEEQELVEMAMKYLFLQGKIEKKNLPDGTDLYFCKRKTREPSTENINGKLHRG